MFLWNRLLENATNLLLGMDAAAKDLLLAPSSMNSTNLLASVAAVVTSKVNRAVLTSLLVASDSDFRDDYSADACNSSTLCHNTNSAGVSGDNGDYHESFCGGCSFHDLYSSSNTSTTATTTTTTAMTTTIDTAFWFFSSQANYYGWCLACCLISLHLLSIAIANVMSCYQFVCAWNLINRTNTIRGSRWMDWQDMLHQMEQDDEADAEEDDDDHDDNDAGDEYQENDILLLSSFHPNTRRRQQQRQRRHSPPRHVVLAKKRLIEQSLTTFSYPEYEEREEEDPARFARLEPNNIEPHSSNSCTSSTTSSYSTLLCPICLVDFVGQDVVSRGQFCHHTFHHECITEWLSRGGLSESKSCPCCRQDMLLTMPMERRRPHDEQQQQHQYQLHHPQYQSHVDNNSNDYQMPTDDNYQHETLQRHDSPSESPLDMTPASNEYLRHVLSFFFGQDCS